MPNVRVAVLLDVLARAYDRRSWHGTNLRGSVRGLTPDIAARRPAPGRHNIWELVVHAAYWKYAVWRRLTGAKRGSFPLEGSNFFERPAGHPGNETLWREDLALLAAMHRDLVAAVEGLSDADLDRRVPGSGVTVSELVEGVAAHDLYHAGQIQLIKRLVTGRGRRRRGALAAPNARPR